MFARHWGFTFLCLFWMRVSAECLWGKDANTAWQASRQAGRRAPERAKQTWVGALKQEDNFLLCPVSAMFCLTIVLHLFTCLGTVQPQCREHLPTPLTHSHPLWYPSSPHGSAIYLQMMNFRSYMLKWCGSYRKVMDLLRFFLGCIKVLKKDERLACTMYLL